MPECLCQTFNWIIHFRMCVNDYKISLGFTIYNFRLFPNVPFRFPHNFLTLPQSSMMPTLSMRHIPIKYRHFPFHPPIPSIIL